MNLFHFIDPATKYVVYADKPESGELAEVSAANPGFLVVSSKTGQPSAPRIFPGFLYYNDIFWAPLRSANQITGGDTTLSKDNFLRLFTFEELTDIYNHEDAAGISKEHQRALKGFLRYLDGSTKIDLAHPTIVSGLKLIANVGLLEKGRKTEVLTAVFKQ